MEKINKPLSYRDIRSEVLNWLGPKIRGRMIELKITQPMLEEMTGIGASTISDYINGRYEPSLSKIMILGEALNVDWIFFFEKEGGIPQAQEEENAVPNGDWALATG